MTSKARRARRGCFTPQDRSKTNSTDRQVLGQARNGAAQTSKQDRKQVAVLLRGQMLYLGAQEADDVIGVLDAAP